MSIIPEQLTCRQVCDLSDNLRTPQAGLRTDRSTPETTLSSSLAEEARTLLDELDALDPAENILQLHEYWKPRAARIRNAVLSARLSDSSKLATDLGRAILRLQKDVEELLQRDSDECKDEHDLFVTEARLSGEIKAAYWIAKEEFARSARSGRGTSSSSSSSLTSSRSSASSVSGSSTSTSSRSSTSSFFASRRSALRHSSSNADVGPRLLKRYNNRKDLNTFNSAAMLNGHPDDLAYDNLLSLLLHRNAHEIIEEFNSRHPKHEWLNMGLLKHRFDRATKRVALEQGCTEAAFKLDLDRARAERRLPPLEDALGSGKTIVRRRTVRGDVARGGSGV